MSKMKLERVRIDKLVHAFDVREKINEDWACTLGELLEAGKELPPIDINDLMEILDGRHRVQGAVLAGRDTIMANVHKGLVGKNALLFSANANSSSGLPVTMQDYTVVVRRLLFLNQTESEICRDLKLPGKMLRPIILKERENQTHVKLVKAREAMATGATIEEASKIADVAITSIRRSLVSKGKNTLTTVTRLKALVSNSRTGFIDSMRRCDERIRQDLADGLISREESHEIWEKWRAAVSAASVKISDYEGRLRPYNAK